jgi:hypothetical protein
MRETTALLCKTAVTKLQEKIAFKFVLVLFLRNLLNLLDDKFFMASSKICIPKRNIHKPPTKNTTKFKYINPISNKTTIIILSKLIFVKI